jgi:hypothetical protein
MAPPWSLARLPTKIECDRVSAVARTYRPAPRSAVLPVMVRPRRVSGWKLSSSAMAPPCQAALPSSFTFSTRPPFHGAIHM